MPDKLEALGVPSDPTLRQLRARQRDRAFAAAFEELMSAELCLAEIDLDIEFLDPCMVPIAAVGNGDHYGLYLYPPLQKGRQPEVPVVQFWHEGPCVELEAASVADWIAREIRRGRRSAPAAASLIERELGLAGRPVVKPRQAWREVLPTGRRIDRLRSARLAGWLLDGRPPAARDLRPWERDWVAWWVSGHGDDLEREALVDLGLDAYRALGWKLPDRVLTAQARYDGVRPAQRPARDVALWCRVHRPSRSGVDAVVRDLVAGHARAAAIVTCWTEALGWTSAAQQPALRRERTALGDALVAGLARAGSAAGRRPIERLLIALEYEEELEAVVAAGASRRTVAELERARATHAGDRDAIRAANDWSDVL